MKRTTLAAMALAVCPSTFAAEPSVSVAGFDDMSCGAWIASAYREPARAQYLAWFRGFISGANFAQPQHQVELERLPSNETLSLYVDQYCRRNPLNGFPVAAFELVKELRKQPSGS